MRASVRRQEVPHAGRVPAALVDSVHQTDGRSNGSGQVPVWTGTKPVQIQNSNSNLKKIKNSQKFLRILEGATNLIVSNFLKNSFI